LRSNDLIDPASCGEYQGKIRESRKPSMIDGRSFEFAVDGSQPTFARANNNKEERWHLVIQSFDGRV
jgi:hypothetical protein